MKIKADFLERLRKERGLTQVQLANRLGITQGTFALYETGKRNPKIETVKKIAKALNVGWSMLCDEDDSEQALDFSNADTVQWHKGLPSEHESEFARLKGTDKWRPNMFEKTSNAVLVTIEICGVNGTPERFVIISRTMDGKWSGIPSVIVPNKVIAWTDMPAPFEG